jgi:hypothetical protein
MVRMGKYLSLCLVVILVVSSLLMANSINAQTIPKPSVPEFTLRYVEHPYDVPPTYRIDPYTGKSVLDQAGYHAENRSVEITIRNQPFTPYVLNNEYYVYLLYNVSYKGFYEGDWRFYAYESETKQSTSQYTVISFPLIPTEGQMDFRIKAQIGYFTEYYMPMKAYDFHGETSSWSNTQTITIPYSSASVTPAPSSTNSQSSTTPTMPPDTISDNTTTILLSIIVATLVISIISLILYVRHLKKNIKSESTIKN